MFQPDAATVEQPVDVESIRDAEVLAMEYGTLRVLRIEHTKRAKRFAVRGIEKCLCECLCGAVKWVAFGHLQSGAIKGCGCGHLALVFKGTAPLEVEAFGRTMSLGQLAALAGKRPTAVWARMLRGMSAEDAAFGAAPLQPRRATPRPSTDR